MSWPVEKLINKRVIMNLKTFLGLAAVAVLVVATFQFTNATPVNAAAKVTRQADEVEIRYARLIVSDDETQTTFLVGGNNVVRLDETLRETYQRLGGRQRADLANLLDQIGSNGWRLIQKDGNTWIFSQRVVG